MIELMFGSGSPMWTPITPTGYQPVGIAPRPLATPLFGSPALTGGGGPTSVQGLSAPGVLPTPFYGYAGGVTPGVQPGFAAAGLPLTFPFASNPLAPGSPDPTGSVTASSLLAAVAMRRGQPQGPTNDQEVEEFLYDALDLLPGAADVEVRCENGRATFTGTVQHKRTKRDVGEIAWAIPALQDVQNNVTITSRRRARAGRDSEAPVSVSARKHG